MDKIKFQFIRYCIVLINLCIILCTPIENYWTEDSPRDPNGENWFPPVLHSTSDTIVSQEDTLILFFTSNDEGPAAGIKQYMIDIGLDGWDDSTETGRYTFLNNTGGALNIRVGAVDKTGLSDYDTFTVMFNRKPRNVRITNEENVTKWVEFNKSTMRGKCEIYVSADDDDGDDDTLRYRVFLGTSINDLVEIANSRIDTCRTDWLDTNTTYHWKIVVRDIYGDTAINSGNFKSRDVPPIGGISRKSVSFTCTEEGHVEPETLYVWNEGKGIFDYEFTTDQKWLEIQKGVNGSSIDVTDSQQVILSIDNAGLSPGSYNAKLYLHGNTFTNDTISISLRVNYQIGKNWEYVAATPGYCNYSRSFVYGTPCVYKDNVWLTGGGMFEYSSNEIFYSNDLKNWTEIKEKTAVLSPRKSHSCVVFDNMLWITGGLVDDPRGADLIQSEDGLNWYQVPNDNSWSPRSGHSSCVFQEKLWIISGSEADAWFSNNGETWELATATLPFGARSNHNVFVFRNKLWLIGGNSSSAPSGLNNDIYSSTDGISWATITSEAAFPKSSYRQAVWVYNDELYLMTNDATENPPSVWKSADGSNWEMIKRAITVDNYVKGDLTGVVFKDNLYVISKKGIYRALH